MAMSMPIPCWMESGAYNVQPAAVAPLGVKKEPISNNAATGSNQKDQLLRRAKAISQAPTIIGTCQLAKPVKAGMMAPKTITKPCMVVS